MGYDTVEELLKKNIAEQGYAVEALARETLESVYLAAHPRADLFWQNRYADGPFEARADALMRRIPDKPVYCTANGVKSLKGHYHQNWNFQVVKTGDKLSLGKKELVFVEAMMLHWPDSMMSYLTGDAILFSNDAFGQHIASEHMFNDLVVQSELFEEATKYYANILTPFSPLVTKKINEVVALNLPLSAICPSHGVIWRDNPLQKLACQDPLISEYLPDQEIANLMNPTNHVGLAPKQAHALAKSILEVVGNQG